MGTRIFYQNFMFPENQAIQNYGKENSVEDSEETFNPDDVADSDDTDVEEVVKKDDTDGKGGAVVPKGDFESYATDEVEVPDDEEK
jgi:hypothetical protein